MNTRPSHCSSLSIRRPRGVAAAHPASQRRAALAGAMRDCRGFTLVELMVVLVIVGLMGTAVVLAAPDDSRTLVREADTFAARLVHAGEEAILTARVVQVTVDAHGYAFAHQSFGQWQALDEGPFEPVAWTEGTAPVLDGRQVQASFRFEPTGGSVQQRVLLARNGRQVEVAVDASGEVRVHAPR